MKSPEILWNPMKFYEILRNPMKSPKIPCKNKKTCKIPYKNRKTTRVSLGNSVKSYEILRNLGFGLFFGVFGAFFVIVVRFFWCLKGAPMENFSDSCWRFWDQLLVIFGAPLWDLIWYPDLGPYKTFCYVAWNFARAIFRLFCSPFWTFFLAGGWESSFGV